MGRVMRRQLLALVGAAGLLIGVVPVTMAADWATFGSPTVESSFETGVRFSQPVTVSQAPARAELLLTIADALGPTVINVPNPPTSGAGTLTHLLDAAKDHMLPNTTMVARWRLVSAADPADVALGP
jgi:hypothetical protein